MSRKQRKERKFRRSKLERKVFKVPPQFVSSDGDGRYLPYCSMGWHVGIIKNDTICQERECKHYIKLYFPKGSSR